MESFTIANFYKFQIFSHLPCWFYFPAYTIWGTMPHLKWQYFCLFKNQLFFYPHCFFFLHCSPRYIFIAGYFSSFKSHHNSYVSSSLPSASSCLTITFSYFVLFIEHVNVSFITYVYYLFPPLQ